jgi:hypothetical protein
MEPLLRFLKHPLFILLACLTPLIVVWIYVNQQPDAHVAAIFAEHLPEPLKANMRLGWLAAFATVVGLFGITRLKKHRWLAASFLLALIIPMATGGFWFSTGQLGVSDWDYYFSYHTAIRRSITEHHTFPLWNPYICGGTAGLADPESPIFTPTFLLELIFGVPIGLRLAIYFATITGAIGMLFLGKKLKLSLTAAFITSLGFSLGSVNLLEIIEGHPNIFSAMWVPWIFWSWIKLYHLAHQKTLAQLFKSPVTFLTAAFLTLTFFQGGIYMLMYVCIAFLFLIIVLTNRPAAFKATFAAGVWALAFAAIKLIPVLFWLQQFQDQVYASSASTLKSLHHILLGRYFHGPQNDEIIPHQGGGWHEYGAYLGPFILALATLALTRLRQRKIQLFTLATLLALLISASGPFLKPFFDQAPFLPRSNISRFILFAILPISLLAGFGIDRFNPSRKTYQALRLFILFVITVDLATFTYPLSHQAFVLDPPVPTPAVPNAPMLYTLNTYQTRHQGVDYTRAYAASAQGWGTVSYCSVLGPKPAIKAIEHTEEDPSLLSSPTQTLNYEIHTWTPNRVETTVTTQESGELILNANYAQGWQVNNQPAQEIANRVGTKIDAGTHNLTFKYIAPGFRAGLTITIASLIAALYFTFSTIKWRKSGQASSSGSTGVFPSR